MFIAVLPLRYLDLAKGDCTGTVSINASMLLCFYSKRSWSFDDTKNC